MKAMRSDSFSISKTKLLQVALRRHRTVMLSLLLSAAVIFTALALMFDLRWLLVLFMVLLIVAPMVLAFLFFNYALSPRCFPNIYPHIILLSVDGLTVEGEIPPLPLHKRQDENADEEVEPDKAADNVQTEPKKFRMEISKDEIGNVTYTLHDFIVRFKGKPPGFLIIPYSTLPDSRKAQELLSSMTGR